MTRLNGVFVMNPRNKGDPPPLTLTHTHTHMLGSLLLHVCVCASPRFALPSQNITMPTPKRKETVSFAEKLISGHGHRQRLPSERNQISKNWCTCTSTYTWADVEIKKFAQGRFLSFFVASSSLAHFPPSLISSRPLFPSSKQ